MITVQTTADAIWDFEKNNPEFEQFENFSDLRNAAECRFDESERDVSIDKIGQKYYFIEEDNCEMYIDMYEAIDDSCRPSEDYLYGYIVR